MPASEKEYIVIGGVFIPPGKRKRVGIEVAKLYRLYRNDYSCRSRAWRKGWPCFVCEKS